MNKFSFKVLSSLIGISLLISSSAFGTYSLGIIVSFTNQTNPVTGAPDFTLSYNFNTSLVKNLWKAFGPTSAPLLESAVGPAGNPLTSSFAVVSDTGPLSGVIPPTFTATPSDPSIPPVNINIGSSIIDPYFTIGSGGALTPTPTDPTNPVLRSLIFYNASNNALCAVSVVSKNSSPPVDIVSVDCSAPSYGSF